MRRCVHWGLLMAFVIAAPGRAVAQGFIEHIDPPVLERGKTTRVAFVGTNFGKAITLWSSVSGIKAIPVNATRDRVELDVIVAGDAPVGVCGIRLASDDGLSNAALLLIDDLPVRPVAAGTSPMKASLPAALWTPMREAAVNRFVIDVVAGQTVSFEAVGNRLGKDVDPLITIRDADGKFVLERDNDPGLYFDFRFEHTFTKAGTYTIELRDARFFGSPHGYCVLRMGRFPAAQVVTPAVARPGKANVTLPDIGTFVADIPANAAAGPVFGTIRRPDDDGSAWLPFESTNGDVTVAYHGNHLDFAAPAKVPGSLSGILQKPGERHFYRLDLGKGQKIQVRAEAKGFNSPADLELAIVDSKGKDQRRVNENPQKEEIVLDFNAGNPGSYYLAVRDLNREGGPTYGYVLDVRSGEPQVQVTAEAEGLSVPRGSFQTLPLNVTRTDYNGPVALSLVGAPPGVTLTPSEIPEKANAIVCQLSAGPEAPLGPHTIQILAKPTTEGAAATLVRHRPLIDKQIVNVDLIPHALREDQRRLPPSLTDRFAVQVTAPSPFNFELPEALVTLGRYQHVEFPIVTTRVPGFDGPITFAAKGGQLGPKTEGRTRVYAELPPAKADQPRVVGSIHSLILTNTSKYRVDMTATGVHQGRQVSLTRTFELDVKSAFNVTAEPATLKLEPGTSAKLRITAERLKTFDGEVTVQLSPIDGLEFPERLVIPRGQSGADVEVKVAPTRNAGRVSINLSASGTIGMLEEETRGGRVDIDVAKTTPPKK